MMLQVQDITTFYGEALAIDKVSFDVEDSPKGQNAINVRRA